MKLTLQVVASDLDVLHRHLGLDVAEKRHHRRQADTSANHLTGICVSELMRNDFGNADGSRGIGKVGAQLFEEALLSAASPQQVTVGREGVERAEEAQAVDEFTDKRIHRDHSFGLQLAERHVNRPAVGADMMEAIIGKVGAFTDPHAGMAK